MRRIAVRRKARIAAEIAESLLADGNRQDAANRLVQQRSFIRHEKESSVSAVVDFRENYGPAQRTAKIVEIHARLQKRPPRGVAPRERICGAESRVAVEFVGVAMDPVGSGLQHRIKNGPAGTAPLWRQSVVDDVELLNRILRRDNHGIFGAQRRVQTAVKIPGVRSSLAAVRAYRGTNQVERIGKPAKLAVKSENRSRWPR